MTTGLRTGGVDMGARSGSGAAPRPVLLATLDAPLLAEAARFGVDSAVESGQPLIVVNAVETTLGPCSRVLGYDYIATPEIESSLRAPADLAHGLGVRVERICVRSTQPVEALIDFAGERGTGLFVLGADPSRIRARRYRRAVRKIRERSACLLWLPAE
ncbi:MAG: hypothetical protein M3546_16160 [Actinomycetota bacterium]|nr:hypothetical protein [Actinomycetota bacterium]